MLVFSLLGKDGRNLSVIGDSNTDYHSNTIDNHYSYVVVDKVFHSPTMSDYETQVS